MVKMTEGVNHENVTTLAAKMIGQRIHDRLKAVAKLVAGISAVGQPLIESVHHLRTETRRADVSLRLFKSWLPHRRRQRWHEQLHEIRRQAAPVRDLDVLAPLIDEFAPQLPDETRIWLRQYARKSRRKHAATLKGNCKQVLKQGLTREIRMLVRRVSACDTPAMTNANDAIRLQVRKIAQKYRIAVNSITTDVGHLHQVRIIGRRLRYALEQVSELNPDWPIDPICRQLSELQDSLGRTNDRQLVLDFLRRGLAGCDRRELKPSLQQVVGAMEAESNQAIVEAVQTVRNKWINIQSCLNQMFDAAYVPSN